MLDDESFAVSAPRLRSAVWVSAYMRRCAVQGAFTALSRHGDDSAGAIFIEILHGGGVDLWGPAPGGGGRVFERLVERGESWQVGERIEREARFDSDLWLVTVEDREGRHFLEADEHV